MGHRFVNLRLAIIYLAIFLFLCKPQQSGASWFWIDVSQITKKILTKAIFHWLELITEVLSFLQISLWEKQPLSFLIFQKIYNKINNNNKNISDIFWASHLWCIKSYKDQTQLVGLFLKKGVLVFVVKMLD